MLNKYLDTRLIKYLSVFYGIAVLIKFSKQAYWKQNEGWYETLSWFELFLHEAVVDWLVVLVFMIFISFFTERLIKKKFPWVKFIVLHLFLSVLLGCFTILLRGIGYGMMGETDLLESIISIPIRQFLGLADKYFLVYFSMVGIIYVYHYIKKVKNIELQKSKIQTQLANTKLDALKAQIHPHFVFNTLNSISSLIEIDPEKSQNLIADFGDLFREILEFKDEDLIPLKKELDLLNKYIDIISVRFSDHLKIETYLDQGLGEALIPSLSIQPILENAIKHGYSLNHTELEIKVSIRKKNNQLSIEIENNGVLLTSLFEELLTKGTGLKNTRERLTTIYKTDFDFSVENKFDKSGVTSILQIPLIFKKEG
jgi:sensor histidine kinase YesM